MIASPISPRVSPPPRWFGRPARPTWLGLAAARIAAVLFSGLATQAGAQTWDNSLGGNWDVPANWAPASVPVSGSATALTFGAGSGVSYTATNTIDLLGAAFQLRALVFEQQGAGTITLGLAAPAIGLEFVTDTLLDPTITLTALHVGGAVVQGPITLSATTTITGTGTGQLSLTGPISGGLGSRLVKETTGTLSLTGGGTWDSLVLNGGTTQISAGVTTLTALGGFNPSPANEAALVLGSAAGQSAVLNISNAATLIATENALVGEAAGSTGTVTVSGPGSTLAAGTDAFGTALIGSTSGRLGIGNQGTGSLAVTDGGAVFAQRIFVARLEGSSGTLTIDGAGSIVNGLAQFSVGNQDVGTLTITNGGQAFSTGLTGGSGAFFIGNTAQSATTGLGEGRVTVTGFGSNLSVFGTAAALLVGNAGIGTLTITDGGTAFSQNLISIGEALGGTGTVTVSGAGSSLLAQGTTASIVVGNFGTGTLTITDGGTASAQQSMFIGDEVSGIGTVNVGGGTGASTLTVGPTATTGGTFALGFNGQGTLNVTAGGTSTINGLSFVGIGATGQGTINITGDGNFASALMSTNANIILGGGTTPGGLAELNISNGGRLTTTAELRLAQNAFATALATIDGPTSSLLVGSQLTVGWTDTATLTLTNAASATITGITVVGRLVDAANGTAGEGTLEVFSGSTFTANNSIFVATSPTTTGEIIVSDVGSFLSTTGFLLLGGSGTAPGGTATLEVSDSASLSVAATLRVFANSSTTFNSAASVQVGGLEDGVVGVNFGNVSNTDTTLTITGALAATYTGTISGNGELFKTGTANQTLAGTNTYTGVTTVSAGALTINGVLAGPGGAVIVEAAGFLAGQGDGTTSGRIERAIVVDGVLSPGTAGGVGIGILTGTAGLTLRDASIFDWDLAALLDSASGTPGVDWDVFALTGGDLTIEAGATFAPFFVGGIGPDSLDPFWNAPRVWEGVISFPATTVVSFPAGGFVIDNSAWLAVGEFSTLATATGVNLVWTPIPEPRTWAMSLAGLAIAALTVARRRHPGQ